MTTTAAHRTGRALLAACAIVTATVSGGAGTALADSIGIAPVIIDVTDALRGGTYPQSLLLDNDNPSATVFEFVTTGAVGEWIAVLDPESGTVVEQITVPPSTEIEIPLEIVVPDDVANGDYEGGLDVLTVPDETATTNGGAGVSIGGTVLVNVSVTGTERREAALGDASVAPAEVGMTQRFTATVVNTGNVQAVAEMDVTIRRDGADVTTLSTNGAAFAVGPGETGDVWVEWDTAEAVPGDYDATFVVRDVAGRTVELGALDLAFRLEPIGTYTRNGRLDSLRLLNDTVPGGVAQIEARFQNAGQILTTAVLTVQVERDGVLIDTLTSLGRAIEPGVTEPVVVSFDTPQVGEYRVTGVINYDGRETDAAVLEFTVAVPTPTDSAGTVVGNDDGIGVWVWGAALLAALASVTALAVWRRRISRQPAGDEPAARPLETVGHARD